MKIISSISHVLGSLFVLSLSACILASPLNFDSILHGVHQNIVSRSLPGSLAFAPEGAVGQYQPPPGPIVYDTSPATSPDSPDAPATAENTDENDVDYGSKQALAATEDSNNSHESHIPSVSEMDAMIAAQTGSARKDTVRLLASLVALAFVSLLHM